MAHSRSALKRWRQNQAHRERNKPVRSSARTAVKTAHAALQGRATVDAGSAISQAASVLDRAAKRRVIHRNAASRHKSRMMRQLNRTVTAEASAEADAPKRTRKAPSKPRAPRKPATPRARKE